jgi:hypothetical protein
LLSPYVSPSYFAGLTGTFRKSGTSELVSAVQNRGAVSMNKWAIPLAAAGLAAVIVAAGAAFALTDSGDDSGPGVSRDVSDESGGAGTSGDVAGICLEGAIDCDDTVDTPQGPDVCIQVFPTPPECADPDTPVSNEPGVPPVGDPGTPGDTPLIDACTMEYPNECTATAAAKADLASRLGVAEDEINVEGVEFVEWPDSCLGVSQPDMVCAEVITPGYRIILEANGQTYEYHTDGGPQAVLAE